MLSSHSIVPLSYKLYFDLKFYIFTLNLAFLWLISGEINMHICSSLLFTAAQYVFVPHSYFKMTGHFELELVKLFSTMTTYIIE